MVLERGDYFELTRAADRVQLAQLAVVEAQRRFREIAIRVGLDPTVAYRSDDATCSVELIDAAAEGTGPRG